jgi:hypothetical protein
MLSSAIMLDVSKATVVLGTPRLLPPQRADCHIQSLCRQPALSRKRTTRKLSRQKNVFPPSFSLPLFFPSLSVHVAQTFFYSLCAVSLCSWSVTHVPGSRNINPGITRKWRFDIFLGFFLFLSLFLVHTSRERDRS